MPKLAHSNSYHLLKNNSRLSRELEGDEGKDKSSLWKAVVNVVSDVEGTGLLALPYVIAQSGLVSIAALVIVPFIAYHTGAILIDCFHDNNDAGERVRVRSNYKELGQACSPRFGGFIAAVVQIVLTSLCSVLHHCTLSYALLF